MGLPPVGGSSGRRMRSGRGQGGARRRGPMPADTTSREAGATTPKWRPRALLSALGPGLIAGASDIDPTTVATLAVVGASTVYGLPWLVVLSSRRPRSCG